MTVLTPNFLGNPEILKKTYFTPPPNLPKRLIRGGGAGRGATVRRRLRNKKRTNMGKLPHLDVQVVHLDCRVPKTFAFLGDFVAYPTELVHP